MFFLRQINHGPSSKLWKIRFRELGASIPTNTEVVSVKGSMRQFKLNLQDQTFTSGKLVTTGVENLIHRLVQLVLDMILPVIFKLQVSDSGGKSTPNRLPQKALQGISLDDVTCPKGHKITSMTFFSLIMAYSGPAALSL